MKKPDIVIFSNHPATIEFIRQNAGLPDNVPVLASSVAPRDVEGKIVYGNLPLRLAALARMVVTVEYDGPTPSGSQGEYGIDQMHEAGAHLRAYRVNRAEDAFVYSEDARFPERIGTVDRFGRFWRLKPGE